MNTTLRFTNYKLFCAKIIILSMDCSLKIPEEIIKNIIVFFALCDQTKDIYCIAPHKWNISFFNSIHLNINKRILYLIDHLIGPCYNNGISDVKWSKYEKKLVHIAKKNIKYFRGYTVNNLSFDNLFNEIIKRIPPNINNLELHAIIFIYWGEITNILMKFGIDVSSFCFQSKKHICD